MRFWFRSFRNLGEVMSTERDSYSVTSTVDQHFAFGPRIVFYEPLGF